MPSVQHAFGLPGLEQTSVRRGMPEVAGVRQWHAACRQLAFPPARPPASLRVCMCLLACLSRGEGGVPTMPRLLCAQRFLMARLGWTTPAASTPTARRLTL